LELCGQAVNGTGEAAEKFYVCKEIKGNNVKDKRAVTLDKVCKAILKGEGHVTSVSSFQYPSSLHCGRVYTGRPKANVRITSTFIKAHHKV
jgi:hypothetical protein